MSANTDRTASNSSGDMIIEVLKVVLQALAIAFVVRLFFFQPFSIPSGSMENTLLVGDYIFVSKYSYGYSRYSFWPLEYFPPHGRILSGEPQRGDVIVFRYPSDTSKDYIKRLVGLPGDQIQMMEGVLYINGTPVPKVRVADYVESNWQGMPHGVPRYEETLPNGVKYFVLDRDPHGSLDTTGVFTVPPGSYFMMGDNRDNSSDSRDPNGGVGYVPAENLIGRAQVIFFSCDGCTVWRPWEWPVRIRWSRFFKLVY